MTPSERSTRSIEAIDDFVSESAAHTHAWGKALAERLAPGVCVLLVGDLGAGKTTLVRGIAEGLNIHPDEIHSPTFVLIHEHEGRLPLVHVDAYRANDPDELVDVGLLEYLNGDGVTLIEWGDQVRSLAPEDAWEIHLSHVDEDRRRIQLFVAC